MITALGIAKPVLDAAARAICARGAARTPGAGERQRFPDGLIVRGFGG
jgi:hypothetical protein